MARVRTRGERGEGLGGQGVKNRRVDFLVLLLLVGFLGVFSADPASAASKFEPPDGQVITGVDADQRGGDTVDGSKAKWDEWTALMGGKPADISHTFEGFDTWFGFDLDIAKARNATPMITWQTSSTQPDTIAQAGATSVGKRTDQVLLQNARLAADYGKPVFLRVDQEMNAPWFPWGPYDDAGQLKKEADGSVKFTPADFRQMWKRMEIAFRGGYVRDINAALAAEGPPAGSAGELRGHRVDGPALDLKPRLVHKARRQRGVRVDAPRQTRAARSGGEPVGRLLPRRRVRGLGGADHLQHGLELGHHGPALRMARRVLTGVLGGAQQAVHDRRVTGWHRD